MTTKKYPENLHTQKILIFLKPPENIEIQNYEPQKDPSLHIRVLPVGLDPWLPIERPSKTLIRLRGCAG